MIVASSTDTISWWFFLCHFFCKICHFWGTPHTFCPLLERLDGLGRGQVLFGTCHCLHQWRKRTIRKCVSQIDVAACNKIGPLGCVWADQIFLLCEYALAVLRNTPNKTIVLNPPSASIEEEDGIQLSELSSSKNLKALGKLEHLEPGCLNLAMSTRFRQLEVIKQEEQSRWVHPSWFIKLWSKIEIIKFVNVKVLRPTCP